MKKNGSPMLRHLKETQNKIPPCNPPFWARGGHLQTILGHLLPSDQITAPSEEFLIPLESENEKIHSTYIKGNSEVVVYIFHGLGGSADAGYMNRTALIAHQLGHHVFINNHRGCGKGEGLAREAYHCGRSEDLSSVIRFGRQKFPEYRHIAIGFSLSANALLLLSAGVRGDSIPDAGIAVNGPINLTKTSFNLERGLNKIYDKTFVWELQRYIKKNRTEDFEKVKSIKSLRDFDDAFTAKAGGFKNREHYYESCSARYYLQDIKIPVVLITSKDDPFISHDDYLDVVTNDFLHVHIENSGGHMGYLSKRGWLSFERWQDLAIKEYLLTLSSF
jgi:predicted alpha/beta-fold hydrolase